jgi:hypothetical protein
MQKRNTPPRKRSQTSGKDGSKRTSAYFALFGCGLILISGFFFAARQHFASMDYGIKNSRLRKQIDDLKAEKQRLLFARELSLSPNEIKRSAERAGLYGSRTDNRVTPKLASVTRDSQTAPAARNDEPAIIKTALVQPTAPRTQKAVEQVKRTDKLAKSVLAE